MHWQRPAFRGYTGARLTPLPRSRSHRMRPEREPHRTGPERGRHDALLILVVPLLAFLACFAVLEGGVRLAASRDADGNLIFMSRPIPPLRLPVRTVGRSVREYLASGDAILEASPLLGWRPKPGARSRDGLYRYDSRGLRVGDPPPPRTAPAVRIALFGDSFTQGNDVGHEQSWGSLLERRLAELGVQAEVLNFGVPGYGMDQAYLRWREEGRRLNPDVVVFGFQPENARRNLNLVRAIYTFSGFPFTKPRFVRSADSLALVNSPVLPPTRISGVLADFHRWPERRYEGAIDEKDYRGGFLDFSAAARVLREYARDNRVSRYRREIDFFRPDGEAALLAGSIVDRFSAEVSASGSRFVMVHLPTLSELRTLRADKPLPYAPLLAELRRRDTVVDPGPALLAAARENGVGAVVQGHYTARGNAIVAEVVAAALRAQLSSPASANEM